MQTDIFLQKALVEVVKEELKGYVTLNNGEMVEFNVYPQNLPAKQGKNDKDHFPYVLVCLDEETIAGEDSNNICSIYFLVGIQDQNPNRQGHFDVANVLNKLQDRFLKDRDRSAIQNQFPDHKEVPGRRHLAEVYRRNVYFMGR